MEKELEYTTPEDEFFDFFHCKYTPKIPLIGKLRSSNLLIHSFDFMKCNDSFYNIVETIKEKIGLNNLVWGIKKDDNGLFWELYFYNYQKKNSLITISNMLNILKPFFDSNIKPNESIPYFMFSMDLTPSLLSKRRLDGVNIYINGRSGIFAGLSFFLGENGLQFKNHYDFYNPKTEMKKLIKKIKNSAFVDFTKIRLKEVLLPELINCRNICITNKRECECIYFVGVNINQFIFFLNKFGYPREIINFIESNKSKLDHLQYEVSIDYRFEDGKLKIIKSGYYGTF